MSRIKIIDGLLEQKLIKIESEGLVILFPITRVSEQAEKKWLQIVELCNESRIASLVVIDKTPKQEATTFFSTQQFAHNHSVYVLIRQSKEAIYDSQKYIKLAPNSWIIQLHDDDEWDGRLQLLDTTDVLTAFQIPFHVGSKAKHLTSQVYNELPARINFTLIPSLIWNRFTNFIESQSGHIAGSADATLHMIVHDTCLISNNLEFKYYYNIRHWKNDSAGKRHLTELSRQDGWKQFSSPEIAVLNRSIDNLAALSYFADFYTKEKLLAGISRELSALKLGFLKTLVLHSQTLISKMGYKKYRSELFFQLKKVSKISSISDVISCLECFPHVPLLEERMKFWIKELRELMVLSIR